jgi:hypothetical protein
MLAAFESDYKTMQEQMIYGDPLAFSQLIEELKAITNTFNQIDFSEHGQ